MHLIYACSGMRLAASDQALCASCQDPSLFAYLQEGILEKDIDAIVCTTTCLGCDDQGPSLRIDEDGPQYHHVDRHIIDRALGKLVPLTLPMAV